MGGEKLVAATILIFSAFMAQGVTVKAQHDARLKVRISKSGLNIITNPPYRIVQVTGDESLYRLKHDQDGGNIFLMPLAKIGERIEISLKNNVGTVHDLEFPVAAVKGTTINIDSITAGKTDHRKQPRQDLAEMVKAMNGGKKGKFYVRQVANKIDDL